ncbi:MAG TPA: hypothetical protein ENO05_09330, partial [Bacteroides sp.]|nr:hypothetical protein [Bacteroides sp.]
MAGSLLFILFIALFIVLLPVLALVSVLMNDFPSGEKLIWVLVILFLPILGSILY